AFLVEELLPLPYHTEVAVVQHHDLHRNLVLHDCAEFLGGHLEPAITDDGNDVLVGRTEFCTQGGRQGEAHRSGTTGGDVRARVLVFVIPRCTHLVLTDVGNHNGFTVGHL